MRSLVSSSKSFPLESRLLALPEMEVAASAGHGRWSAAGWPQLLVFCQHGGRLFFLRVFLVLHGQSALSKHREKEAALKVIQRLLTGRNAHHAIDGLASSDGQVQAPGIRKRLCRGSGTPVIVQHPPCHLPLLFRHIDVGGPRVLRIDNQGLCQLPMLRLVYNNVPLKQLHKLPLHSH